MTDTTMPDGSAAQQVIDRTVTEVAPEGTVSLSNPRAIFAGSPPRSTRSRVTYEACVVSKTSTRPQVDSAVPNCSWQRDGACHQTSKPADWDAAVQVRDSLLAPDSSSL